MTDYTVTTDPQTQIDILRSRVIKMEAELLTNTAITKQVKEDTGELIEAFKAAKGAWAVLEFIGRAAKPVLWIISVCTAVYHFWRPTLAWLCDISNTIFHRGG